VEVAGTGVFCDTASPTQGWPPPVQVGVLRLLCAQSRFVVSQDSHGSAVELAQVSALSISGSVSATPRSAKSRRTPCTNTQCSLPAHRALRGLYRAESSLLGSVMGSLCSRPVPLGPLRSHTHMLHFESVTLAEGPDNASTNRLPQTPPSTQNPHVHALTSWRSVWYIVGV